MGKTVIIKDLTQGNVAAQLSSFVAPLLLSNILQTMYGVVDMLIVGRVLQTEGISALSICNDLMTMFTFFAVGFSNAGQVLVAQYIGGKQLEKTQHMIGALFFIMGAASLGFFLFSFGCGSWILAFVKTPEGAFPLAGSYLSISIWGLFFVYGYNAISGVLRGLGDSKHPLVFVATSSALNIVLDIGFVIIFGWGVKGAAIATVLSQFVSFTASAVFMYSKKHSWVVVPSPTWLLPRKEALIPLFSLGMPMAMKSGLIHFSKLFVARWVNAYGVNVSAITGVGNKINSIAHMFDAAVSTSVSSMVGQCVGAKKYDRVVKILLVAEIFALGITAVISAIIAFMPARVFSLFNLEQDAYSLLPRYIPVLICLIFGSAFRAPISGLINGSGKTGLNYFVAIAYGLAGQIGLPALLAFTCEFGLDGLWYGYALSAYIPFFIGIVFFVSGRWKRGEG